jgi:peptidoglycan-associated lipoprotein
MRKILLISGLSAVFLLAGCAHTKRPSNYSEENGYSNESAVTSGIGSAVTFNGKTYDKRNLIDTKPGPHYGLLAKRSFYFAFNSNVVKRSDYPAIRAHANYLLNHKNAEVILEGNADIRGSREYNIALGQRRANAVRDILRMQGISSRQIRTVSFGAEKPVATDHTEAAYALNRRVDIVYK